MKTLLTALTLALLVSCTSIDQERSILRGALANADGLATEVNTWSQDLASNGIPEEASTTMASFQKRAAMIHEEIDEVSAEAAAGVDLTAVKQSLRELKAFDVDQLGDASQGAREAMLAQFRRLSTNVKDATMRANVRMR